MSKDVKYCNCGVCLVILSPDHSFYGKPARRVPYRERSVPVCGDCGKNNDDVIRTMLDMARRAG